MVKSVKIFAEVNLISVHLTYAAESIRWIALKREKIWDTRLPRRDTMLLINYRLSQKGVHNVQHDKTLFKYIWEHIFWQAEVKQNTKARIKFEKTAS